MHSELAAAGEAVIALLVSTGVVWPIRGVPDLSGAGYWTVVLVGLTVVHGLSVSTRQRWCGGHRHRWESAVAVSDPGAALPTSRQSWARGVDADSVFVFALMGVGCGLLVGSPGALLPLASVSERVASAAATSCWERRTGLILWQGELAEQPLGKGQLYYSTPRKRKQGAGG